MTSAANLYHSVINDVITSVRDSFLDEAVDESVLQELKQLWTSKLDASKTIEAPGAAAAAGGRGATGQRVGAAGDHKGVHGRAAQQQQQQLGAGPSGVVATGAPGAAVAATGAAGAGAGGGANQLVITDPNRLVPVQITIPAQPGNPASQARGLTVQVPAHALQQSGATSQLLQQVLTTAITQALSLPESHAAVFLQNQINQAFKLQ